MQLFKEFKHAFRFLGVFLSIYLILNVVYGVYIESFNNVPDPITFVVTKQAGFILNIFSEGIQVEKNQVGPTVFLKANNLNVVSVFEGCNGINVIIVYVAFLFAFGGPWRILLWFIPTGLAIIHFFNLGRIAFLYFVSRYQPDAFYFFHKYMFTAVLYMVVFGLWVVWVLKYNGNRSPAPVH